tara:strand:- start:312 stop:800 length:489 start_codon:yes stop_codon:yes gene_type:complete
MLLNPYYQQRIILFKKRNQKIKELSTLVPKQSYNPLYPNFQESIIKEDHTKKISLQTNDFVLIDDDTVGGSPLVSEDEKEVISEGPENNVKVVNINQSETNDTNDTSDSIKVVNIEPTKDSEEETNDEDSEGDEGEINDEDEPITENQNGGDLIKNVIVSFF